MQESYHLICKKQFYHKNIRGLIEEKDWDVLAIGLERPMDVFCWVAVTAAVIVLVPLCIRLLAG